MTQFSSSLFDRSTEGNPRNRNRRVQGRFPRVYAGVENIYE